MASHRVGETGLSESGPSNHHIPYLHGINPPTSFNQEGFAFDFGELEEAIALQGVKINYEKAKTSLFTARPAATLEMFPSWPTRFHQTPRGSSRSGGESTDSGSAVNTLSSKAEAHLEPESPMSRKASSDHQAFDQKHPQMPRHQEVEMASDDPRTGSSQIQVTEQAAKPTTEKVLDPLL